MEVKINEKIIENVAMLAKLKLSDEEIKETKDEMEKMIGYANELKKIDTENVEPMYQVFPNDNVFRDDMVKNKDDRDNILANAPDRVDDTFVVPKTFN